MRNVLLIGSEGYIGSYLKTVLTEYNLVCVDNDLWGEGCADGAICVDYNALGKSFVQSFDVVILLAGHSSVKSCEDNMKSVYNNNVRNFVNLLDKLKPEQKFIYASSGSVLSGGENFTPANWYDLSKHQIDQTALLSGKNIYGLRFGTVNGWSPKLRTDLMINAMVESVLHHDYFDLYGSASKRPILGVNDLAGAVKSIIDGQDAPGIYELASFNTVASEIAGKLKDMFSCQCHITGDMSSPYSFEIDNSKFSETFGYQFTETVESIVKSLVTDKETVKVKRNHPVTYE